MVNRGDGGSRRPAPPAGRPAPRPPARPSAEDEEKTSAINLADVNLDDLDEAPMPAAAAPSKKLGTRDFVDDDNEKTNALNLADVNLDDIDSAPMPRPQPAAPGRPAPAAGRPTPAPRTPPGSSHTRPQPGRPAPRAAAPLAAADEDEKTSALSLDEVERAARARPAAPAAAPAKRTAPPARQAPVDEEKTSALSLDELDLDALDAGLHRKSAAPPPRAAPKAPAPTPTAAKPVAKSAAPPPKEPEVDKTTAVSMDDLEDKQSFARAALAKLKKETPTADSTFLVDDEEVPFVKAPPSKKAGKASEVAAPAHAAGDAEPKLVVRAGPDLGKSFTLTKDLTLVGRGLDADVVINDAAASRKHFNIVRTLNGWKMVDLGSGNGTKIDGNRVTELALKHGMQIEAGGTTLEWVHDGGGRPAAATAKGGVRETVPEPAPAPRSPTLLPGVDDDGGRPSRRAPEQKAPERKRDPSRLEKFDAKDELGGKGGGKQPPPSDEKTTFGDIQALEIDPEWEARRLKQRREGVADVDTTEAEVVEAPRGGGVGKKIAIAGIIVGVLGGGFVAADKFAGLGIIFPKEAVVTKPDPDKDKPAQDKDKAAEGGEDKAAEGDKDKAAEGDEDKAAEGDKDKAGSAGDKGTAKEDAKAKVAAAEEAAKEKRWFAARGLFAAAIQLDDLVDGGDAGLAQAEAEIKALGEVTAGGKAIDEGKWGDAVEALEGVKEGSSHHASAQELMAIAKEGAALEQRVKANKLFANKDLEGAKAAITKALEYASGYGEGTAFKEAIERAAAPDADLVELDPADPNAKNPPKAQPSDLKPALDAYAKGDFQAAFNAFDNVVFGGTASRVDVARAKAWGAAATTVDEAMKQLEANAGKPDEQLNQLRIARRADAILGGGQRTRIAGELAKAWSAMATRSLEAKELATAGLQAKLALSFDAASADAKAVQDTVAKEAKAWVAEAKGLSDAPDKAADLLARAMRALPPSDPDFAEADKALTALMRPTE